MRRISCVINLFLCFTILAFMVELCVESVRFGNGSVFGPAMMFTNDSNLLLAISCGLMGAFQWKALRSGRDSIPVWVYLFKYVAVCQVILTCLVVLFFLVGIMHSFELLGDFQMIYFHVVTPVAGTLSWLLWEAPDFGLPRRRYLFAPLLPLCIYAIVYMEKVIVLGPERGGWRDFYHLTMGGFWPLSFLGMHLIMLGISWCLGKATGMVQAHRLKTDREDG